MNIIPVIDLLQGQAVHAIRGRRAGYRPVDSPLCRQGEVMPLIERLCDDLGMQQLYLADLDAIQGKGNNLLTLQTIAHTFPQLILWIDAGFSSPAAIQTLQSQLAFRPVIGSESWQFNRWFPVDQTILSVDSVDDNLRDPSGITRDSTRRPNTLILMNLSRVGSLQGPDMERLASWQSIAPDATLYMAGGVRNRPDIEKLQSAGAAGVLLASALHNGALTAADFQDFS
ncbi:HisA/HisF-related TIM barrel protein [Sedimenticola sp.]|uniref:HisA/HisF-related TIM barrel protein n=1 Tax=Sedimenticola sp. TaxID=1940285 RepID=UPI00258FBDE2|nr:HisA/HisF-related TIM barrel protein [Sedimenticola sp.]MCW8902986.1 HisA/HisF-related TIM barrel protein [Sedimenticola sp.]